MPDAMLGVCGSFQQDPLISPLCLTFPKSNEWKNHFHYVTCQKVARYGDQIKGIMEPYPCYFWCHSGAEVHGPCPLYLSGTLITIGYFLRKSSPLPWLGQHWWQFKYCGCDLFPPALNGPKWLSILCCSGCNLISWQPLSCGLAYTYQRWKIQVHKLHELRDKDFCINQSSTSGWAVQEGAVSQIDLVPPGQYPSWLFFKRLWFCSSGFRHCHHLRLYPPPCVPVLL